MIHPACILLAHLRDHHSLGIVAPSRFHLPHSIRTGGIDLGPTVISFRRISQRPFRSFLQRFRLRPQIRSDVLPARYLFIRRPLRDYIAQANNLRNFSPGDIENREYEKGAEACDDKEWYEAAEHDTTTRRHQFGQCWEAGNRITKSGGACRGDCGRSALLKACLEGATRGRDGDGRPPLASLIQIADDVSDGWEDAVDNAMATNVPR
nr:hypothetical protein CFP56_09061 [Quercus suber]